MDFLETFVGRDSTIRDQSYIFKNHIQPYEGKTLEEMVHIWTNDGLVARTVLRNLWLAGRYFQFRDGRKPENFSKIAKIIKRQIPAQKVKALSKEDANKLLSAWVTKYPDLEGIFLLGFHAGLRVSEVFNLKWRDVDILRSCIYIVGETKSGKPRTVPMTNRLEKALLKRQKLNSTWEDLETPVFKPIKVNDRLKLICGATGVTPITFHWLRHTFATLALDSGKNSIKSVSITLGHSDIKTTMDIYWHILDAAQFDTSFLS